MPRSWLFSLAWSELQKKKKVSTEVQIMIIQFDGGLR